MSQLQAALDAVRTTLRLNELDEFLEDWRRMAWLQTGLGPERYRAMIAKAKYLNEHGHPPPGTKTYSADEMREMIRERLAAAQA